MTALPQNLGERRLALMASTVLLLTQALGCGKQSGHQGKTSPTSAKRSQAEAAPADVGGWHQVGGDGSNTYSSPASLTPPLHVVWRQPIPTSRGPLVAYGPVIYAADNRTVAAIDSSTGRVLWTQHSPSNFFDFTTAPFFPNTAATGAGLICQDSTSTLCLAAGDGHVVFRSDNRLGYTLGPILLRDDDQFLAVGTAPGVDLREADAAAADTIQLKRLDSLTGRQLDQRPLNVVDSDADQMVRGPFGPEQIGAVPGPGQRLFARSYRELITIVGGLHGRILGRFYTGDPRAAVSAQAGRVLLLDYPTVTALDLKLRKRWTRTLPSTPNPATAALGYPPPNTCDGTGCSPFSSGLAELAYPLVVTPKRVVVGDWQHLYGLDAATGRTVWAAPWQGFPANPPGPPDDRVLTSPAAAGSVLYALSRSRPKGQLDSVVAFSLSTGHVLWSQRVGSSLRSLIIHDGALYVGDENGQGKRPPTYFLLKLTALG